MMCFRDRTYCFAYTMNKCANSRCDRAVTKEVRKEAEAWWGPKGYPPIAYSDMSEGCPNIIVPKE